MGILPSPVDCELVNRSIKTLPLRMSKHEDNAKKLVELLKVHPNIDKVIYPKKIPKQMMGCGGMISFYIKGDLSQTKSFLNNLKMIPLAESLGGVESLIEHPGLLTHASINEDERKKLGIADNLIRLSVGLENVEDIYKDIEQSLSFIF
jgi:cystathionine beta-lyase/cystathionine gamma-synthase